MSSADREAKLSRWIMPSSDAEQDRQGRAERMTSEAMRASAASSSGYRIYPKGSYANNTNVRADSDVDIVVECYECFYYSTVPDWRKPPPYLGSWNKQTWRPAIEKALIDYFGASQVDTSGSTAINVAPVPGSRPSIDVVPSFEYHLYAQDGYGDVIRGSTVFQDDGNQIVNWPAQQLENGREKNRRTGRRYKRFARALKSAENELAARGEISDKPSYMMECLAWNVPDSELMTGSTLDEGFLATLCSLINGLNDQTVCSQWMEPNEIKEMFAEDRAWDWSDAVDFVVATWKYMGYGA
nr:nucleotidyltransferase [Pseudonocardia sp. AL041005-10]